jgi:hypothetical protein
MWRISWVNIRMMLADAQGYKEVNKEPQKMKGDELAKKLGLK